MTDSSTADRLLQEFLDNAPVDDTRIEMGDAEVGNLGAAVLMEEAIGPKEAVIQEVATVGEATPEEEVAVAEEAAMPEAMADRRQVVLEGVEAGDVEVGPEGVVDPEIATILAQIYNIYQQTTLMVFCHKETKDACSKLLPRQSLLCDRYQALQMITHQRDKKPYLKLLNDWRSYEEEINKLMLRDQVLSSHGPDGGGHPDFPK